MYYEKMLLFINIDWDYLPFSYDEFKGFMFKILYSVIIIIIGKVCIKLASNFIKRILKAQKAIENAEVPVKRLETIQVFAENIVKYLIYFLILQAIISQFASAAVSGMINGVVAACGVAIGLGAQSLMKDIIAGFFIIIEGQFSIGDTVEIAGKVGKVEKIGLRTITLRTATGEVIIIPNGIITTVTNWEKTKYSSTLIIYIPYDEDIEAVISALTDEMENMGKNEINGLIGKPSVLGVTDLGEANIQISIRVESLSSERFEIERLLRLNIKKRMEKEGFKNPHKIGGNNDNTR